MTTTPTPECQMCEADTGHHPAGAVARREKCGCDVAGFGLLPNPWHIHYCPLHAAAPEMRARLCELLHSGDTLCALIDAAKDDGEFTEALDNARALLARIAP